MQSSQEQDNQSGVHLNSTPESKLIVIQRKYDVPVNKLFKAFSSSEALKSWWWPNAYYTDRVDLQFSVGGTYYINMRGTETNTGMTGQFEEIVHNERIVMTDHFADETGNPITAQEAKMPGNWPETVYITFDFTAIDARTSMVKLTQEGIPTDQQSDCYQGWSEMFDKLHTYLAPKS